MALQSKDCIKFNNQTYKFIKQYKNCNYRLNLMLDLVGSKQNVLDLGAGTGVFLKMLENNNNGVGVEISTKAAKKAIKNGLKVKISDLTKKLPFNKNSFDSVTAGEVIEHIFDTDFLLKEIKRVLKPNGFLIISTPNLASLGRRLLLLLGMNPLIETSLDSTAGHIRYFTKGSLMSLLTKHNFLVTEYKSDVVNFNNKGNVQNKYLAKLLPTLGASIIFKATNIK